MLSVGTRSPWRRRSLIPVLAAVVLLTGLAQPATRAIARTNTYEKLAVFTRVLSYVQNNYVEEMDSTQLIYGAIKGMLSTLDAHSAFMTPEEYEEMKIDTGGEFGGIGLEVAVEDERLTVVAPLDGTPAFRAGLRTGDVILKIDGSNADGMSIAEAVRRMRGAPGTKVTLRIDRDGFTKPRDIPLMREHVRLNPVEARVVDGYAVIRIKSFQERTGNYLEEALRRLEQELEGDIPGLVLDLRSNPGGLLDQAVSVADRWLSEGVIVKTRGRGTYAEISRAHRAGTEPGYPMVVLVNEGSASASEIVAGALQDHGRAVLMGTSTFGKGSVQTVMDLEDGSGLKLTVARYFTPSGRPIGEQGVHPDVVVEAVWDPDEAIAKKESTLEADSVEQGLDEAEDRQLKAALDALRTWRIFMGTEKAMEDGASLRP